MIQLVSLSDSCRFLFIFFLHQRMYHLWKYVYIQNTTFCFFLYLSIYLYISPLIAAISSHQRYPIDEHRYHRSRHLHDTSMTNEDSSLSGTPRSSAHSRSRPMPTSYSFWLNTGDNNNNNINANFMRLTYAASCRSRLSRSVERCPRACRGILSRFQLSYNTYVCAWASSYDLCVCVYVPTALLWIEEVSFI